MTLVGLDDDLARRFLTRLSGGQRRRIAWPGRSPRPPLLLIDEPFSAVNPISEPPCRIELLRLQAGLRETVVLRHSRRRGGRRGRGSGRHLPAEREDRPVRQPRAAAASPADGYVRTSSASTAASAGCPSRPPPASTWTTRPSSRGRRRVHGGRCHPPGRGGLGPDHRFRRRPRGWPRSEISKGCPRVEAGLARLEPYRHTFDVHRLTAGRAGRDRAVAHRPAVRSTTTAGRRRDRLRTVAGGDPDRRSRSARRRPRAAARDGAAASGSLPRPRAPGRRAPLQRRPPRSP